MDNKEPINSINYIFMALSFWSHAYFSTSIVSTTKKNERITKNRLQIYFYCESYLFRKMSHQLFAKSKTTEFPLQLVHTNLGGHFPYRLSSPEQGILFYLLIILPYSQESSFLKQKSGATFCKYKQLEENQTSRTIRKVKSDNGREYVSQE